MKEAHLKSMKRKTTITSVTHYHFYLVKINSNENRFPMEIDDGECLNLFSIRMSFRRPRTIFQRYHPDAFISLVTVNSVY